MTRAFNYFAAVAALLCAQQPVAAELVYDFSAGDDGGFTTSGTGTTNWTYTGSQWEASGENNTDSFLSSGVVRATSDTVNLTLNHAYDFESPSDFIDGGVLELSINGGAYSVVTPTGGYPTASTTADGVDALGFIPGWGGDSGGSIIDTFAFAVNTDDDLQFRFHGAWDGSTLTPSPNWSLASVTLDNAVAVPEPSTAILLFCCSGAGIAIVRRRMRGMTHTPS